MKLLVFFMLMSFVSLFYVVTSQREETTFVEDLDAPNAISNSTNVTGSEFQHGFKSKVGKVVGKVKSKVTKVVEKVKNKITKVVNKIKEGGGGSSGGGRNGGGSSGGSGLRHRYKKIDSGSGSGSGSYSNYSATEILLIVFGLTGAILLLTGIMYFACKKL